MALRQLFRRASSRRISTMTAVTVARDTRAARIDNLARPLAQKGEIVVAVRKFSFTANNIIYALAGDTLGYFDFYPCADEGRAMVPTWGTAEVVDSNVPGVAICQGIYGFLPKAQYAGVCVNGFFPRPHPLLALIHHVQGSSL